MGLPDTQENFKNLMKMITIDVYNFVRSSVNEKFSF